MVNGSSMNRFLSGKNQRNPNKNDPSRIRREKMPKKSAQKSEYSSVGRTSACQAEGHEFDSRYSLHKKTLDIPSKFGTI